MKRLTVKEFYLILREIRDLPIKAIYVIGHYESEKVNLPNKCNLFIESEGKLARRQYRAFAGGLYCALSPENITVLNEDDMNNDERVIEEVKRKGFCIYENQKWLAERALLYSDSTR